MLFGNDTQIALAEAATLVNTLSGGVDELESYAGLDRFLERFPMSGGNDGTDEKAHQQRNPGD